MNYQAQWLAHSKYQQVLVTIMKDIASRKAENASAAIQK